MPVWQLTILIEALPVLAATEALDAITATTAPHLQKDDRRYLIEMLRDAAGIEKPIRNPMLVEEHNPARAAEYFKAMGITVVESA